VSSNFALIGVAGYIAPRHLKAIADTGNNLIVACDPHDSVGILDRYFDSVSFFREFERFDRHIERLRREPEERRVHYVSICSPNFLHDAHVRFALRVRAVPICEKPLVLNPWNCDALMELEHEYETRINTILQLRLHPSMQAYKQRMLHDNSDRKHEVVLTYITSRGDWYLYSWKGNIEQSGGLATNIGIHFFDILIWLFGSVEHSEVHLSEPKRCAGYLELANARVRWRLSIDKNDLPREAQAAGKRTYRSIEVDGEEMEFSDGFEDLHTRSYEMILQGKGFSVAEARPSTQLAHDIRNARPTGPCALSHPGIIK
jgi:UDP-N-acetyl-2-amino-2-deoxyglucuronate dehydrogenase